MKKNIISMSYPFILILIVLSVFAITDVLSVYNIDRYGIFMSIFMYSPIGMVLLALSAIVGWKDEFRTKKHNYILMIGASAGIALMILPPLLFWVTG